MAQVTLKHPTKFHKNPLIIKRDIAILVLAPSRSERILISMIAIVFKVHGNFKKHYPNVYEWPERRKRLPKVL